MGRYRRIEVRIHADEKYRRLSDSAKLLFLTLLTHPSMTSIGAMRFTPEGCAAEMRWTIGRLRQSLSETLSEGLAEWDQEGFLLMFPNFLKHNPPENPNVVKSWRTIDDLIPECPLKRKLYQRVKAFAEGLGEAFAEALPEAFGEPSRKGMPNPEPEPEPFPEQEQEPKNNTPHTPRKRGSSRNGVPEQVAADFETFWLQVPVKIGKGAALEEYARKRAAGVTAERILEGVVKFTDYEQQRKARDGADYRPLHPRTWLRQARWEDEIAPATFAARQKQRLEEEAGKALDRMFGEPQ